MLLKGTGICQALKSLKLWLINDVTVLTKRKRARKQDKHSMAVRTFIFRLLKETGLKDQQQGTWNLNLRPRYCSAQSSLPLENLWHTAAAPVCVCVQCKGKLPDIMLYCEWNRSVEQKVWNESPLLGFWARVRGYVYMPTQHGKRSMCLSIWSATQICLTLHKCTHLRWNADQSFLRSYLTGILWNIVYTYYLELPSLLGRSQCFISATSGRVSGIRRSIKFAKSGQNLHGLCREESKGVTPNPSLNRAERLISAMDRASCWGGTV